MLPSQQSPLQIKLGWNILILKRVKPSAITKFEDLTWADDYRFGEVMRQPENSKPFLEALLGKKIERITAIDKQKDIKDGFSLHGIRLDVCLEDEQRTQYDVEMDTGTSSNLEQRIRYYQSSIDRRTLEASENYRDLRQSYVIFICTDDYYKRGLAIYKRKSVIEGAEDIVYEDGSHAYILNARFTEGNASDEVLAFLRYIDAGHRGKPLDIHSEYVAQIEQAVEKVKTNEELEGTYMTLVMKLQDMKYEGAQNERLANLKTMMETLNLSADEAMDALRVPEKDRQEYRKLLEQ